MLFYDVSQSENQFDLISFKHDFSSSELTVYFSDFLDRTVAISRLIASILGKDEPVFLVIQEFGIWPSLENWDLFNCLRASDGESRLLPHAPGQDFTSDEGKRLLSYIQMIILNGWGGLLIGRNNFQRIFISHDSWFAVRASAALTSQLALIDHFGLPHQMEQNRQELSIDWRRHRQSPPG